jgi:hypothetical protein
MERGHRLSFTSSSELVRVAEGGLVDGRRIWRLETLIPGILVLFFVCDAALRFMPLENLSFRPDDAMINSAWSPGVGPFWPQATYYNPRASGDLANLGNLPALRVFRPQSFTTDKRGYRNPAAAADSTPPSVLLYGTSFSAGSGNSDAQILSTRLAAITGCRVFNAGMSSSGIGSIGPLVKQLGMTRGLVILEQLERYLMSPATWPNEADQNEPLSDAVPSGKSPERQGETR